MSTTIEVSETEVTVTVESTPTIDVEVSAAATVDVEVSAPSEITVELVQWMGGGSGNATALQGRPIDATAPTSGQALVWSGTDWEPGTITSGVASVSGTGAISVTPGSTPVVSVAEDAAAGTTSTRKIGTTAALDTTTAAGTSGSSTEASAKDHTHKIGAHASTHATGGADAIAQLAKLDTGNAVASYLSTIQTVSAATATVSAGTDLVEVTYSSAACTVTLPTQANAPIGTVIQVSKANTGAFKITVTPDSGSSINGGAANASVDIPNSTIASTTTTSDIVAQLRRTGASTWRLA